MVIAALGLMVIAALGLIMVIAALGLMVIAALGLMVTLFVIALLSYSNMSNFVHEGWKYSFQYCVRLALEVRYIHHFYGYSYPLSGFNSLL